MGVVRADIQRPLSTGQIQGARGLFSACWLDNYVVRVRFMRSACHKVEHGWDGAQQEEEEERVGSRSGRHTSGHRRRFSALAMPVQQINWLAAEANDEQTMRTTSRARSTHSCIGANVCVRVCVAVSVRVSATIFNIADTTVSASARPVRACFEIKCRYK